MEGYLKTSPDSAAAHDDLASVFQFEGRYDLAQTEADKAFALNPTSLPIMATLGEIAMLKGDFVRAEAEFQRLVAAGLQAKMAHLRRALVCLYAAQGKYEKALEQIALVSDEAQKAGEPAWLGSFNFFASLVFNTAGRYPEALKAVEQAYNIAEADENIGLMRTALMGKGTALLGLKRVAEARKVAEEAKSLSERYMNKKSIRNYRYIQAQIDIADRNYARAVENAKAAVDSLRAQSSYSNPDAYIHETLARAYEGAGDWENARRTYEGLQKLTYGRLYGGNVYALSFYRVGMIDEKLGDKAGARTELREVPRALEGRRPGSPRARRRPQAPRRSLMGSDLSNSMHIN